MAAFPIDPAEQLRMERTHLVKADSDIAEGRKRLCHQQQRVFDLQAGGHDTAQAERLVQLMQQTLMEWERHRVLIEDRVSYLERQSRPEILKKS